MSEKWRRVPQPYRGQVWWRNGVTRTIVGTTQLGVKFIQHGEDGAGFRDYRTRKSWATWCEKATWHKEIRP